LTTGRAARFLPTDRRRAPGHRCGRAFQV